jgi:flagellar biosynthesis protein FlhB
MFGSSMVDRLKKHAIAIFNSMGKYELTDANVYSLSLDLFLLIVILLAPLVVIIIATAFATKLVQDNGKIEFNLARLTFDFSKVNPLTGFGRLLNKDSMVEVVKSLLKILVVGYIAYRVMLEESQNMAFLSEADIETILTYIGHIAFKIVTHTCGVLIVIGILDMLYVKWRYMENLKMTKQEVKDESKDSEGDPKIKGRIKQLQYEAARRRMVKIIPLADVVITNPTHFAVALKYDREKMIAPVVLVKGADIMAQAIKKIAKENNVVLVENRFLARELYDQVEENAAIPESLYAAVAEVLAYVYRLKGKL